MNLNELKRAVYIVLGVALALAAFYSLFCAFLVLVRDGVGRQTETHEVVIQTPAGAPEESAAELADDMNVHGIQIYVEGSGPAPDWYRPDEPMAVEWSASCNDKLAKLQVCKQVFENSEQVFDDSPVDDPLDDVVETAVAVDAPMDIGCTDYDTDQEISPEWLLDVPLDRNLQEYIHALCEESGLPYTLVIAVVEAESSYRPDVISITDDYGLMQIRGLCHEWIREELGTKDFLNPYENVRAGIWILSGYYANYGYASGALMCYNMGETRARAFFEQGIYNTSYSDRVLCIKYRLETEGR